MPTRTISNTGGNYNAVGTWVEGFVPTSADDVVSTTTSGQLTMNVTGAAKTLDLSTYTNTLTMTNTLTVSGNITLGSGMTIVGTANLRANTVSSTLRSNGTLLSSGLDLVTGGVRYTFADDWNIVGTFSTLGASTELSGGTLYVSGSVVNSSIISSSSTACVMVGTGTVGSTQALHIPLTINTSGTVTTNSIWSLGNKTYTYSAGTFITTATTITCGGAVTPIFNMPNQVFSAMTFSVGAAVVTLNAPLVISSIANLGTSSQNTTINGSDLIINGNLSISNAATVQGTSTIRLQGTGTFGTTTTSYLTNNLIIDTLGTITFLPLIYYRGGTFTYSGGTVVVGGSTITCNAATTWAASGMNFNNITFTSGPQTLNQDLNIVGTWNTSNPNVYNGSNIYCYGSMTISQATSGTANIFYKGTGTWAGAGLIGNLLTIDSVTGGTLTCSGSIAASNIIYSSGTVNTASSTLSCSNSNASWDTNGIVWTNLTIGAGTISLNSLLTASGTTTIATANNAGFAGTAGFSIGTFVCTTAGRTITFTTGNTYDINTRLLTTGTLASKVLFSANVTNSTKAILNLKGGASQDNGYLSGTDIDSSGGVPIWTYKGTLTRTTNWNTLSTNPMTNVIKYDTKILNSFANMDPDAVTFIATLGLTDKTQINAINQLVRRLKAQSLWTKLNAIYPFIGGTSTTHSYNLKNTSQFQITWVGTVTHNSNGITPNGTNGYGNTGYNPSLQGVTNNESIGIYSRTSAGVGVAGTALDMGASAGAGRVILSIRATNNYGTLQLNDSTTSLIQTTTNLDGNGLFIGSRTSSTSLTKSRNGVITDTSIVSNALVPANLNVYIGCRNNSGTAAGFISRNYAFAFLGKGLDSTDLENLNDIIQQYQIILGRKV